MAVPAAAMSRVVKIKFTFDKSVYTLDKLLIL